MSIVTTGAGPMGQERLVGAHDLFFSTTDRRGVIRSGNSVFARLSGYSSEELAGAPHNLVRHPGMPGGAFKVMWDRLLDGKPMAAYIQNRAKDGAAYWVFATVTPLADGFLSVRVAPMTPLHPVAVEAYQRLLATERAARDSGLNRAQAAASGAVELERVIRLLGFEDYEHFMTEALPAEVAARAKMLSVRFANRSDRGPVGTVLAAASALDHELGALVGRLNTYQELSAAVSRASQSMLGAATQMESAAAAAQDGAAGAARGAPVLRNVARAMAEPCRGAVASLRSLVGELDSLRDLIAGLRFRIALARLHANMVANFACEVIDGVSPQRSLSQVALLGDALYQGVEQMTGWMSVVNAKLGSVADEVGRVASLFNDFRRLIGKWRLLVVRHHATEAMAGHVDPIDRMLADGHSHMSTLQALATRCRDEIFPFGAQRLDSHLARIQGATRQI